MACCGLDERVGNATRALAGGAKRRWESGGLVGERPWWCCWCEAASAQVVKSQHSSAQSCSAVEESGMLVNKVEVAQQAGGRNVLEELEVCLQWRVDAESW